MVGQFENSLDAFAHSLILKHVDTLELHADMTENANNGGGETALRKDRRTLHKQNDIRAVDSVLNSSGGIAQAWRSHGSVVCR